MTGEVSPAKDVGSIFAQWSEQWRGLTALGAVAMVFLTAGIALGSMGLRDDVDELTSRVRNVESKAGTNEENIARLERIWTDAGISEFASQLADVVERVRRIDRELCLQRFDAAGTVTPAMQQECARR